MANEGVYGLLCGFCGSCAVDGVGAYQVEFTCVHSLLLVPVSTLHLLEINLC